jgi:hypothetical protein
MSIVPPSPPDKTINAPLCKEEETDKCRFIIGTSHASSMHSPIEYDRKGNPVGGGGNTLTKILHCKTCSKNWISIQSELEDVQKKERVWKEKK